MKEKLVAISAVAMQVLANSTHDAESLRLPAGQLPRGIYLEIKAAFEAIGGKWNKKINGFTFDRPWMTEFSNLVEQGEFVDRRQTFQEFFTPPDLAKKMARLVVAHNPVVKSVLEPSAGQGALVKALMDECSRALSIVAVELQSHNAKTIPNGAVGCHNVTTYASDFMQWAPNVKFDAVIMNPPFSWKSWAKHIQHALTFLKHNGILVALVPGNVTQDQIGLPCTLYSVPADFEHTNISVNLLTIVKGAKSAKPVKVKASALIKPEPKPMKSPDFYLKQVRKSMAEITRLLDEVDNLLPH